ncbi:hypothetical protein PV325_003463 [Microctonus aethiopoides]|nr:hypothetical protein PV325_003463 [Microctonus aethiopoides]
MLFKGNSSRLEFLIERIQAHKESPSPLADEKCLSRSKEGTMVNGSFSWRSEEDSLRGGGTPSSCTTSTSMSFASEPDIDIDTLRMGDGNSISGPYPCQFCDKSFPTLSLLKKHEQSHGDQMPYRCSWCARLFKHKRSRDRHVKLHTGDRRYRCTQCEAAFSRSDHLKIHMKTHDNQKPYHCTECSRGYNTAAALTSHMQSHKRSQSSNSQYTRIINDDRRSASWPSGGASSSPIVNSSFSNIPLSTIQKKMSSSYSFDSIINDQSNNPFAKSSMTLACMYCAKDTFTSMEQLQLHVYTAHEGISNGKSPSISPIDLNDYNSKRLKKNNDKLELETIAITTTTTTATSTTTNPIATAIKDKSVVTKESFDCKHCTMKFTKIILLQNHMTEVHRDNIATGSILSCPLCGIPCDSTASYVEHYVLEHCNNPKIPTEKNPDDSASKTFNEKENDVSKHQSSTLIKEYTMKNTQVNNIDKYSSNTLLCGQCGAALENFELFRAHVAMHLQVNNQLKSNVINCPKCDSTFQSHHDMISHLTKHYLGQPMKQYSCDACDKYYLDCESLKKHLFESHSHHLYRCTLCHDTFDSSIAIQVHFTVKHVHECNVYQCNGCSINSKGRDESHESTLQMSGSVFKSATEMMKHVENVHAKSKSYMNELSSPGNAVSTPAGVIGGLFRCCFCGIYCTSDVDLQLHLASHSTCLYRCPICHEGFTVEFLLDKHIAHCHSITNNNNTMECKKIYYSSEQEEKMRNKRRRSPNVNNNLNKLENIKRPNSRNIDCQRCEYCDKTDFSNDAELRAHKKLVHKTISALNTKSQTKLFSQHVCSYCGESLRTRLELEAHTRLHHAPNEQGKRYKCNICDEIFATGGILAEHKLRKHCKIKLSDVCIVCRGELKNETDFFHHVQKHSLETFDPQHQRNDNNAPAVSHITAHCVVCRQTLISELECQLHAKYHLQNNIINSDNDKIQCCCICLREFCDEDDGINLLSKCITMSEQQLRVCKRCYMRHSQGLPILGSLANNWSDIGIIDDDGEKMDNIINGKGINNDCKINLIKYESYDGSCDDGENIPLNFDNDTVNLNVSGIRPYCCNHCTLKFTFRTELERHVTIHHDNNKATIASSSSVSSSTLQFNIQQKTLAGHSQTQEDNKTVENIIVKEEIIVNPEEEIEEVEEDEEDEDEEEEQEEGKERKEEKEEVDEVSKVDAIN